MEAWSSSTVPLQPLLVLGDSHTLLQAQAPTPKVPSCLLSSQKQITLAIAFQEKCINAQGDLFRCWWPDMLSPQLSLLLLFSQLCHPTGSPWESHSLPWLCSHRRDEAPVGALRVLVVPGEQQGWAAAPLARTSLCQTNLLSHRVPPGTAVLCHSMPTVGLADAENLKIPSNSIFSSEKKCITEKLSVGC